MKIYLLNLMIKGVTLIYSHFDLLQSLFLSMGSCHLSFEKVLLDVLVTVKVAPHESVIMTGQP